jgi:hypothetical protein
VTFSQVNFKDDNDNNSSSCVLLSFLQFSGSLLHVLCNDDYNI